MTASDLEGAPAGHDALPRSVGRRLDGAATRPWRSAVVVGATTWAASRVLVTLVAMASKWMETGRLLGSGSFAHVLFAWDSGRFAEIASNGYFSDPVLPAFFPGYPIAARLLAVPLAALGGEPVVRAMFLIAIVGGIGSGILIWRIAELQIGPRGASTAAVLFFFGPYSLFLHASYSESLFLLFALAAWYFGRTDRWALAGIATFAASATRVNGLFLLGALVVMYVVRRRARSERLLSGRLLALLVGVLAPIGYFLYLWHRTGRVNEWFRAQDLGWHRQFTWPWTGAANTIQLFEKFGIVQDRPPFLLDVVFAVLLVAATIWFAVRRSWPEFTFLLLSAASLLTSTTFQSVARNTLDLFPIAIALAPLERSTGLRRALYNAVLIGGVVLLCWNTHQFTLGWWAD